METTKDRLAQARQALGFDKKADFAECVGIERSTYDKMEKGPHKPSADNLEKIIAKFPDLNLNWLLLGAGPMLRAGRALVPSVPDGPQPDPPTPAFTSGPATVQHADSLLLREQMQERIEGLQADKAYYREMVDYYVEFVKKLQAENNQLLGKPSDSSDAADDLAQPEDPTSPPAPVRGVLPLPRLRVQVVRGFRSYQDAAELS